MATFSSKRGLVWVGLLALIGALAFWLTRRPEESAAADVILRAAAALSHPGENDATRRARLERELAPLLAPDLRVHVPGLPVESGRDRALLSLVALMRGSAAVVRIEHLTVERDGRDDAIARFDAIVSDSQAGDLHADTRRVRARLSRADGRWRIAELTATPEERAEPEARP